jgi:hypothetical protein
MKYANYFLNEKNQTILSNLILMLNFWYARGGAVFVSAGRGARGALE